MDDVELRRKIVGTWTLASVHYEDRATTERTPVYGAHPKGIQITDRARPLACRHDRRGAPDSKNRCRARARAHNHDRLYGRYCVENGKVITRVEAAWNEAWVGTEQARAVRFDGDTLYLRSPPMPHPNIGGKVVQVIVEWHREDA
jgi:hypothetical protein